MMAEISGQQLSKLSPELTRMPSKDWEEALRRIREVKDKRLTKLDLSELYLETLPAEIGELVWLEELKFSGKGNNPSPLSDLSLLVKLTCLQTLYCGSTKVSDLRPLAKITGLQTLYCGFTQVCDLLPLAGLTGLQTLLCQHNRGIRDLSPLAKLSGLRFLNFASTQVSDLSSLAELSGLQTLVCSYNNQLSDLRPLAKLTGLQELICAYTQVSDLRSLSKLTSLQKLNCLKTQVSDLSPLAELTSLRSLACVETQVGDLSPLAKLTGLLALNCTATQVSDLRPLAELNSLQEFFCSHTKVNDLGPLAKLSSLQKLACSNTQVSDLSPIFPSICEDRLSSLYAHSTPLRGIPRELMGDSNFNAAPGLKEYLLDLENNAIENRELKVLFVGNGKAGKTTLSHFLRHGAPPERDLERTHGIIIEKLDLEVSNNNPLRLNLWDFGGQEIYHATHRLFLNHNAIYILLWTPEPQDVPEENFHPVSYWVEYIREMAGKDAVILLVKSKVDIYPDNDLPPDWEDIRDQVESNPITISAISGQGMETLKGSIRDVALRIKDWFSYKLPQSWVNIRENLERLRDQGVKDIPLAHFEQLCLRYKVRGSTTLLKYLHATGFLYHKNGQYRNRIILDQNWAVDAVYQIFDKRKGGWRQEIEKRRGEFDGQFTERLWADSSSDERKIFMDLILTCRICFEKDFNRDKLFEDRQFVTPALLPADPPVGSLGQTWELFLDFQYPIMHRAFIERFIAETAQLADRSEWWRHGIILESRELGAVAMVEALPQRNTISIKTSGDGGGRLRLLHRVANKLIKIHGDRKVTVHGSDNGQDFFSQEEVETGRSHGWKQLRTRDNRQVAIDPVNLTWMIEMDDNETFVEPTSAPPRQLKVFISYAHEDEKPFKEDLEKTLKIINRHYHTEPLEFWSDRSMFAGDVIEDTILEKLQQADIICMLISRDFMASDYCFTKEMAGALRKYEKGSGIPVPIIIRETQDWHHFGIGKHLALPTDGLPMDKWGSKDSFWADVQKGLTRLVERELDKRGINKGTLG